MAKYYSIALLARLFFSATGVSAMIAVDVNDVASIKQAVAIVAEDLMGFYNGYLIGLLPGPTVDGGYSWWTGAALWATMLDYRSLTGDKLYDDQIAQGLLSQFGPDNDFLSPNWSSIASNDHQAVWAMAALQAAETGFAEPGAGQPKWLTLAKTVFDEQSDSSRRVDDGICKGGLRWQLHHFSNGYNYVATSANAAYANVAARLSLLQDDSTAPAEAADKTFQLLQKLKFIDDDFNVYDGASVLKCNVVNRNRVSFVAALALESAAMMYKSTAEEKWRDLVDGLAQHTIDVFFPNGIAKEVSCEPGKCDTDMTFYKSFLHRSLASTAKAAPHTADLIVPVLKSSAAAAAQSCKGGQSGRVCGFVWTDTEHYDGLTGAGPQMSVLSALLSLLNDFSSVEPDPDAAPVSATTSAPLPTTTGTSQIYNMQNSGAHMGVSAVMFLGSLFLSMVVLGN